MLRVIFLGLLLATPAAAQTDPETIDKLAEQYGDFAPAAEEKPLHELMPGTDEPVGEDEAAAQDSDTPVDTSAAKPTPPEVVQETPTDPGPATIPEGWSRHSALGLTFAAPPGWTLLRESDDTYVVVSPDFAAREKTGLGMGVQLLDADDFREQFLEDETFAGLLAADDRPALPVAPGIAFDRFTARPEQTGKDLATEGVISRYRHAEDGHLLVNFIAFDPARLAADADLTERILATFRLSDPEGFKATATLVGTQGQDVTETQEAAGTLGGLVTIRPPEGWKLSPGEEKATLRTETVYSAYVTLRRGDAARAEPDIDGLFQGLPHESTGTVLGQPASVYSGLSSYAGMQVGTDIQRGQLRVYLLRTCLPDGSPVTIETGAAPGWLKDHDLNAALDAITVHWPAGMKPCHPAVMARAKWALDGLFAYVLPDGFKAGRSRSSVWIRTREDPYASLSVGTGDDSFPSEFGLAASNPTGNGFVAPPRARHAEIMGEPAMLFTGRGQAGDGTRMRQVALLDRCLSEGEPVMVEIKADDAWLSANGGIESLLARKWLFMPDDARRCEPGLLQTAMEVSGAAAPLDNVPVGAAASRPAAPVPAQGLIIPGDDAGAPALAEDAGRSAGDLPEGWVRYEKYGISAALPPGWVVKSDNDDDGFVATSADADTTGRLTFAVRFLDGKAARAIISQPTVRNAILASEIEVRPLAPGIDFLKFMIDQKALESRLSMVWLMSQRDLDGRGHPVIAVGAGTEAELRARIDLVERILATVRIVDPAAFKARGALVDGGFKPEQAPANIENFAAAWNAATPRIAQGATPAGWTRYRDHGVSVAVPDGWFQGPPEHGMTIVDPRTKIGVGIQVLDADTARKLLENRKFFSAFSLSDIRPLELAPEVVFLGFMPDPEVFEGVSPGYWLLSQRNLPGVGHPLIVAMATGEAPLKTLTEDLQTLVDIFATARLVDPGDFRARGIPVGRAWDVGTGGSDTASSPSPAVRDRATDDASAAGNSGPAAPSAEIVFWQSIAGSDDPADFEAYLRAYPEGAFAPLARNRLKRFGAVTGSVAAPSPSASAYHTPARGTAERAALMDAARIPVQRELGQPVIFMVERLRSDGTWAYLKAVPLQPDGRPLDWSRTPMARAWAADMMSDLVLVVLQRTAQGWQAVEHAIGPTDVAWLNWVDRHGWPRALFTD